MCNSHWSTAYLVKGEHIITTALKTPTPLVETGGDIYTLRAVGENGRVLIYEFDRAKGAE